MSFLLNRWFLCFYAVFSFLMVFFIDPVHDYLGYFKHWDLVLAGGDPWQKMPGANAYGPVHNLFAYIYMLDNLLPKIFFVFSWIFFSWIIVYLFEKCPYVKNNDVFFVYALFFLNPFFWVGSIGYGFNDNFVALIVFLSLLFFSQLQKRLWGVFGIALAFLTKLYPVFLMFSMIRNRRDLILYSAFFIMIVVSIYLITYFVWSDSFLLSFGKANGRDPTLFSLQRFLHGTYFPYKEFAHIFSMLSNFFLLIGMIYIMFLRFKNRLAFHTAALLSLTWLFLVYKAGQQQFFITYFAVFGFWAITEFSQNNPNRAAFYSVLCLGLWFALTAGIFYPITSGFSAEFAWIEDVIGLPTAILEGLIIYFLLKEGTLNAQ